MHWLLTYRVVDDYAERRMPFRDEHLALAWSAHARGELVLGGALEDPVDSALLVFAGDSPDVAEGFAKADPYVRNGLVVEWTVRRWNTVAGALATNSLRPRSNALPVPAPGTTIGHVHLKVSDLERALQFWHGILGLPITQRYGSGAVFLGVDGYHHHIGLNTWESLGGAPAPPGSTGLYHVALRYPNRRALAAALQQVLDAGWPIDGAADHGVSEAIYLRDPDGNGVELTWDRPAAVWPRLPDGTLAMGSDRLDLGALLAEVEHP